MSNTRPICNYSRQELYDLIWSTPASKLAADFGVSDVAIAKRCKTQNVPRPTRGYWAKVAAGHKPRKPPLPPTPDELFKQAAQHRVGKTLSLPGNTGPLLPLASELMSAITKARLDQYKRAHLREPTLPEVTVSKILAERVARSFHVLLACVEPLGIPFRKSRSPYNAGYFERRYNRLFLAISEELVRPDGSRFNVPWYQSQGEKGKPSGRLTFSLNPDGYGPKNILHWSEGPQFRLEEALAKVSAAIRKHFVEAQERSEQEAAKRAKDHAEWLQRTREWEQKEAVRLQQEKERRHAGALVAAIQARKTALLKAAEKWRQNNTLLEFIDACDERWKSQTGTPTTEQIGWLTWARQIAYAISPFSTGYPDPANDGAFEPTSVLFGGPYPPTRDFE